MPLESKEPYWAALECLFTARISNNWQYDSYSPFLLSARRRKNVGLFCLTAENKASLLKKLDNFEQWALDNIHDDGDFERFSQNYYQKQGYDPALPFAVSMLAKNLDQILEGIKTAREAINNDVKKEINGRTLVGYNPDPLGPDAPVAFVFPGSGNVRCLREAIRRRPLPA